ncbi:MAG: hypothetical protein CMO82_03745 [Winogradskyella sp.]|nr:hypothetical protein [Winogradskyella sp.]
MNQLNLIKKVFTFICFFSILNSFSQMVVKMENIEYLNEDYGDCETINLNSYNTNNISFDPYVRVPHNTGPGGYTYTYGTLTVEYFSGSAAVELESYGINDTHWEYTDSYAYLDLPQINISLDFSLFDDTEGGSIYLVYHESIQDFIMDSCENDITFPVFSISPENVTIACDDNSLKTFTVVNENDTPGSLIYIWNVGSGWLRDGSPVSSFTTTTNSITLEPSSFPPSDVKVEPEVVNGDNFEQLISTVSLDDFNITNYTITGDDDVCDTGIYTVNNLTSNVSILSVSTSDTNIATVSLDANTGEVTVTKVSDGTVTLTVVIQNTCGQTKPLTKQLQIGLPESVFNATISGNYSICSGQNYTYTLSGANHPCVTGIVWSVTDNLSIVSQSSNTITVSEALFGSDDFAGEITASIPGTTIEVKKGVLVGTPSNTGLTLQKLGSYEFYTGEWSMLKANYTPLLYTSNEPLSITYDWQIPHSQIRSFTDTSRKDVNPNSAGQLTIGVRVQCDCGYGEWAYETFTVTNNGGGTGFEMN